LPAAFALSQQDSANTGAAKSENAKEATVRSFVMFIASPLKDTSKIFASGKFV
jgi:hypothetical protein